MVKYRVSVRRGGVEFSLESDSADELTERLDEFIEMTGRLSEKILASGVASSIEEDVKDGKRGVGRKRRGKSEAVEILRHLEERLIPMGFFREARTTAETRNKLKEVVGVLFQSRKVSQALGLLYKAGRLRRVGQKGNYRYYTPK